jgi:hypothetical protein
MAPLEKLLWCTNNWTIYSTEEKKVNEEEEEDEEEKKQD